MDFKSVDPRITCRKDIKYMIREALMFQRMFHKRTSPWEIKKWDYDKLKNFKIEPDNIDRLYYIHHEDNCYGRNFHLVARAVYEKGPPLYVELDASCDFTGFDCQGGGRIYVSWDADIFMKTVLHERFPIDQIYDLLLADGADVDRISKYDTMWRRKFTAQVPMLKLLCHRAVKDFQIPENYYRQVLPPILSNSIYDYVKTEDARYAYYDRSCSSTHSAFSSCSFSD